MKFLVIAPQPFFSPRGTPFSVYYRTQVTCEVGHDVDLLTYGQGADVEIPRCRIIRIPRFSWLGTIRTGPSLQKLFLDVFMVSWTIGLLLRRRYDVLHAHEEAVFWCRWLKPLFRFRLIYDMHSSLPQQLHNFKFTRSRFLHWLFERQETGAIRAADAVSVICPALLSYARTLTRADKVVLIENSLYDPIRFTDRASDFPAGAQPAGEPDDRGLAEWMGSRDLRKVAAYAGTFEAYQGIDRLLQAFAVVVARLPEAGLLVVGGLPREVGHFREFASQLGLAESVFFTGQVPQPEAQRLVRLAAAAISPRFSGSNSPMKIYQLMAEGIPLVATRIESHTQVLNDDIAILSGVTASEIAEAIVTALQDPQKARAIGARAKDWYNEHYSRDVYTKKMIKLLSLVT